MEWMTDVFFAVFFWLFTPAFPQQDYYPGDKVEITNGILKDCQARRIMFFAWNEPDPKFYAVRGWCGKAGHVEAYVDKKYITRGWVRKNGQVRY